jgi:hypothetical protein
MPERPFDGAQTHALGLGAEGTVLGESSVDSVVGLAPVVLGGAGNTAAAQETEGPGLSQSIEAHWVQPQTNRLARFWCRLAHCLQRRRGALTTEARVWTVAGPKPLAEASAYQGQAPWDFCWIEIPYCKRKRGKRENRAFRKQW